MNNNDKINLMTIEQKSELFKGMIIACRYCPVNCKKPHTNQKMFKLNY